MEKRASEFGIYLKSLREKKGVSLKVVENATGISNAYLSQLETGARRRLPSPERLRVIADYYNVSVQELLAKAGYYEPKEIKETYEQKIEKAFLHAISDPRFETGSRIRPGDLTLEVKRYVLDMYARNVRESLYLLRRSFPSSTIVDKDKGIVKTFYWKTEDVIRTAYRAGNKLFVRYRVRGTCIESEGEWDYDKMYYAGPKPGTEKITQTVKAKGEFTEDMTNWRGYEAPLVILATDNAVKKALPKFKETRWASIVKPFGE